ncbi:helix-turn-helix transcriptional regulator [Candidatus Gracilibacteria bacterium 28_42_T64]|nr:helix-turn-helix transcriptional regulator [Candidatus Gracilibacteria bacterium 28_42_T64]
MKENTFDAHMEELFRKDPTLKEKCEKALLNELLSIQIKEIRNKRRLSQFELAKKIGTTQSVIARIESGNANISMKTLGRILSGLDAKIKIEI